MECVDFHWKPLSVLGTMTRFREVSSLNLSNKVIHCDWLLRIQVRNFYGFL